MTNGIGSHTAPNRGATDTWLTPPHTRPCQSIDRPSSGSVTCRIAVGHGRGSGAAHGSMSNGPRASRMWCNPPYGPETWRWLHKLADHGRGTALVFARTETEGFVRTVWSRGTAILFLESRLWFHRPDGKRGSSNAGGPSCLVAYGHDDATALAQSGLPGSIVHRWEIIERHPTLTEMR